MTVSEAVRELERRLVFGDQGQIVANSVMLQVRDCCWFLSNRSAHNLRQIVKGKARGTTRYSVDVVIAAARKNLELRGEPCPS